MKINEAVKRTGLSKKAIRLYEAKGLLQVQRIANGYRDYTEADIEILQRIKLLRLVGVPISDIRLWQTGIISFDELLEKRRGEIEKEYGHYSAQFALCESVERRLGIGAFDCGERLEENEEIPESGYGELAVGMDIGTTTISATVIDLSSRRQIEVYNLPNGFHLPPREPGFAEQDAEGIAARVAELVSHMADSYTNIVSIGVTGQMHGILYLDADGRAVSPLITWQDKRADRFVREGVTYCADVLARTGERVATGYGFATHYYQTVCGTVPAGAVTFCSIMDYVAMRLTGRSKPLIHASVAASFGLFDLRRRTFMEEKIDLLFPRTLTLPEVTDGFAVCGDYAGIPVSVGIGDNQASFLGSVKAADDSILMNIGTGSQISMMSGYRAVHGALELRPLVGERYLICGSALCGGSAYAMLERFFRAFAVSAGMQDMPQYETLNRMADAAYQRKRSGMRVETTFCGTRTDPTRRGAILGLDADSFTPEDLTLGVIEGICRELYEMYLDAEETGKHTLVASGGAPRRNAVFGRVISDLFDMPVSLSGAKEEASIGAALFSATAAGYLDGIEAFSAFIEYRAENE